MLIYEYTLDGSQWQYAAIEEAIRIVQFIRNNCLRLWMNTRGTTKNDLQCSCAVLAKDYPFASRLNSQARQAAAGRAWFAISRFYENCNQNKPGKKGYPQFQHDNRSVEYKTTGWKLDPDGRHLTFTDGCGIGRLRLVGNKHQQIEAFPLKQIKRVRIVHRADGYYVQFGVAAHKAIIHQPTGNPPSFMRGSVRLHVSANEYSYLQRRYHHAISFFTKRRAAYLDKHGPDWHFRCNGHAACCMWE